ncbi:unnamed protein product, partial [Hapterophycus canaliculatus]
MAGESNTGSMSSFPRDGGLDGFGGRSSSEPSLAAAAAEREEVAEGEGGRGATGGGGGGGGGAGVFRRTPKPDAARTSAKFISHGDPEGGASWDEEFFFGRVSGEIAVRIVCVDKPLREGAEDEVVGELLIPVSRLPQNEPVEQWYGLEPPIGSGKTFTKAALLLRFLFTTSASPDAAAAAAAAAASTATASASSGAASGAAGGSESAAGRRRLALGPMNEKDGLPAAGVGGDGGGGMGAVGAEAAARHRGSGQAGLGATSESFRQALLMAGGVTPRGSGGGASGNARRRSFGRRAESGAGGRGGEDYAVDASIDPFGADEMEDDGPAGRGQGPAGRGDAEDTYAHKGEVEMLGAQSQLQLGNWGSTSVGAVHTVGGATAAEAALALSTDEILPAGLVDYFLVVGPAANENGKLRVADYTDCGFGSSGATRAADKDEAGMGELPATAVEVESAVLEHFPEEQREDAPFPTKVEWFCFPQGLFLRSSASQPAPHVSSFVRFTSGVRSYGLCLTFYRRVDVVEETTLFTASGSASRGALAEGAEGRGGGGE